MEEVAGDRWGMTPEREDGEYGEEEKGREEAIEADITEVAVGRLLAVTAMINLTRNCRRA